VTWCGDVECDDVGAWDIACCCLHASGLCSMRLSEREGVRMSFVRLGDSFCSLDRRVHLVFLNAGCCKCVGDSGLALCCCCCLQVCVYVFVCVCFWLRAFSLVCDIFDFVSVVEHVLLFCGCV